MKFIFASLIALTFLSASAQSTEHLNKELMKSKEVYFEAVIEAIALDAMARSGGLEDAVKFEPPNNMQPEIFKGLVYGNSYKAERGKNHTRIMFVPRSNVYITIIVDPKGYPSDTTEYVEAAILKQVDGDLYEVDYGTAKRIRVPTSDNKFVEKIVLSNGSEIYLQNSINVIRFKISQIDGWFALKDYPWTD